MFLEELANELNKKPEELMGDWNDAIDNHSAEFQTDEEFFTQKDYEMCMDAVRKKYIKDDLDPNFSDPSIFLNSNLSAKEFINQNIKSNEEDAQTSSSLGAIVNKENPIIVKDDKKENEEFELGSLDGNSEEKDDEIDPRDSNYSEE